MEKFSFEENPYFKWQKETAKKGNINIGELDFIKYAILDGNESDLKKALELTMAYYESREDLLADIYIKMNNQEEAMRLIVGVGRSDNYSIMTESLDSFISKFPEQKSLIIEKIKNNNPDFYKSIPNDILE